MIITRELSEALQLIGTASILMLGLCAILIALTPNRWCHYGVETLFGFAAFMLFSAIIRFLVVPLELLSQEQARIANGLVAFCFVVSMAQLVFLHWRWHQIEKEHFL